MTDKVTNKLRMLLEDALAAYRQRVREWAKSPVYICGRHGVEVTSDHICAGFNGEASYFDCRLCRMHTAPDEPECHADGCPAAPEGAQVLDDGFGNIWSKCGQPNCGLQIVRPGKVQCDKCRTTMERR